MKMTLEMTRSLLARFAVVFPLPTQASGDDLTEVWFKVIGEFYIDDVGLAYERLMAKLTRFPFPSDVVAELAAMREES